jgi:hypothetical protein
MMTENSQSDAPNPATQSTGAQPGTGGTGTGGSGGASQPQAGVPKTLAPPASESIPPKIVMVNGVVTYYVVLIVTTAVLIWALRLVKAALTIPGPAKTQTMTDTGGNKVLTTTASTVPLRSVLTETPPPTDPDPLDGKGSFSRTAGAIGASGMAAVSVGLGYWVIYALFFGQHLDVLQQASWYFLAGSALFFPYAFNQISRIFRPDSTHV